MTSRAVAQRGHQRLDRGIALPVYSLRLRVYYEDTDSGGVVYYANYLKFMERARTEYLRSLGFQHTPADHRQATQLTPPDADYAHGENVDSNAGPGVDLGIDSSAEFVDPGVRYSIGTGATGTGAASTGAASTGATTASVQFVVRHANMAFVRPARLDDLLDVSVTVSRLGRAGLDMEQVVSFAHGQHRESAAGSVAVDPAAIICEATIGLACVDRHSLKPSRIPAVIADAVAAVGGNTS